MARMKLTQRAIDPLAAPTRSGQQELFWDTELAGFGVRISGVSAEKAFVVQARIKGGRAKRRDTIGPAASSPWPRPGRRRGSDFARCGEARTRGRSGESSRPSRRRSTTTWPAGGRQALTELSDFKPFRTAEKAVASNLALLEERMVELPKPTTSGPEFMLEQEIRGYISEQKSSVDFVLKSMADRRVVSAVLNAPPYLSGLSDTEWNMVRERARAALHPEQSEMQQWLKKALSEVEEGMAAAKRMLLERCEMREDDNGQFRSIREPLPGRALMAAKMIGT